MATFITVSVIAGLLGAAAMEAVMYAITRADWARTNMVTALGSLITRRRENGFQVGAVVHAIAAIGFAMLYNFAQHKLGLYMMPTALMTGIGFGIIHGLLVSLGLIWVVADNHPLEEFRAASFAVGFTHFVGHVAYGAVVGLVIGIGTLISQHS
jgi:hypothetical protein